MYNGNAKTNLSDIKKLPVEGKFDLIWLFSVFTHLDIDDAEAMLRLIRLLLNQLKIYFFPLLLMLNWRVFVIMYLKIHCVSFTMVYLR